VFQQWSPRVSLLCNNDPPSCMLPTLTGKMWQTHGLAHKVSSFTLEHEEHLKHEHVLPQHGSLSPMPLPFSACLHLGLCSLGLIPVALSPPPRSFPHWVGNPMGFYHLRFDHPGLGRPGIPPVGLDRRRRYATFRDYASWGHPQVMPCTPAPDQAFNTQAFPQHGCSWGLAPFCLLL
jgi:hypothetical protein